MTKRARYNGQYEVHVAVDSANVFTKFVTVPPGGLLPLETDDGDPVPVSVRDDLLANHPDWSEVKQPDHKPDDTPAAKSEPAGKDGEK